MAVSSVDPGRISDAKASLVPQHSRQHADDELRDLRESFKEVVLRLEDEQHRIRGVSGTVNNLLGTAMLLGETAGFRTVPPSGCQGQALLTASYLRNLPEYRQRFPAWTFTPLSNYPNDSVKRYLPLSGYHWVVKAESPDGRVYMLDPHKNRMDVWQPMHDHYKYPEGM